MIISYKKSLRFFFIAFLFLFSLSCSKQPTLFHVQETKSYLYEINKDLGEDSAMIKLIKPFTDSLDKTMGNVISISDQRMTKIFPDGLLGNFLTDLIFNYAKNTMNLNFDFCLQNNGGFRAELPAGPITVKNLYEIFPFDNELQILEIDPKTMDALLRYFSTGEALSISGIKIIIHKNRNNEAFINDLPIDTTKSYLMATSDYLANGGSNMTFLKNCKKVTDTKIKIRDIEIAALEQKYSSNQHLNSKPDGRIQVVE